MSERPLESSNTNAKRKFSATGLFANGAIASVAAGGSVIATTGLIAPAIIVGLIGGIVSYSITSEIPDDND